MCATHRGFNKSGQLFLIPLPLSGILSDIKCPHPVEIQNTCTVLGLSHLEIILDPKFCELIIASECASLRDVFGYFRPRSEDHVVRDGGIYAFFTQNTISSLAHCLLVSPGRDAKNVLRRNAHLTLGLRRQRQNSIGHLHRAFFGQLWLWLVKKAPVPDRRVTTGKTMATANFQFWRFATLLYRRTSKVSNLASVAFWRLGLNWLTVTRRHLLHWNHLLILVTTISPRD